MNPLLLYPLIATAVFTAGAFSGYRIASNSCQADLLVAERAAHAKLHEANRQLHTLSAALEDTKHEKQIVYKTITKNVDRLVERPVYRHVCLDDDGLRNINAALAGQAADPGQPAAAVSAPVADGGKDRR